MTHSPTIHPEDWLRFVQVDPFPRQWANLQLNDDSLRALELGIMASPDQYPLIRGGGGLRKLRFSSPYSNRGKRGSYRVYYVYFSAFGIVLLLAILAKNDQADLTRADIHVLANVIREIEELLQRGIIR